MSDNHTRTPVLQPTYSNNIPLPPSEHCIYEGMINCLGACVGCLGSIPLCCCFPNPFVEVTQGKVGLVTRFGKYYKTVDPGLYRINLFSEKLY